MMVLFIFACFKTDVPPQEEGKIPEVVGEASSEYGSTTGVTGDDSSGTTSGGDSSGTTSGGDSSGGTTGGDSSGGATGGSTGGSTGGTTDGGGGDDISQICDDSFPYDMIIPEGECYSQMISCGDVITSTTATGTSYYNVDHYNAWFNNPNKGGDYEGQEHAFYFYHPGTGDVDFTLETPCDNMDMLYFRIPEESPTCYTPLGAPGNIQSSNGQSSNPSFSDEVFTIYDPQPYILYYIIVESRNNLSGGFRLTVDCNPM